MSPARVHRPAWAELPLGDHLLAESPRWDAVRQRLSWVDLLGGTVATATRSGAAWGEVRRRRLGRMPTAAEPLPDGSLAVAVDGAVCVIDPLGEVSRPVAVTVAHPEVRTNDMTVDPAGRLLVGLFSEDRVSARGGVVALDLRRRTVTPVVRGYVTANGLAVSPDGRDLYAVDTARATVRRHRLDGPPEDAGRLLVVHEGPGRLDGLAVGPDGDLWVAVWDAGLIHRYDPRGTLRQVLAAPVARPTAVLVIESRDGRELVVTTARGRLPAAAAGGGDGGDGGGDGDGGDGDPRPEAVRSPEGSPSAEGRLYAAPLPD